ncbi:MAG: PEP-CTERM sorting domain-containing protein [Cyanothece sp. SIO1E1]|nr:PEP-CTERM sorting domain-containing protein [Cyanothece sp. SIO1E1]
MFEFSQKIAAIAAGSLVAFTVIEGQPAQAITFFSFEVELTDVVGGPEPAIGGTFTGTFSFDETVGFIDGDVELFDLVSFDFDFLGSSFDIGSDAGVASLSSFPTVAFEAASGDILGVDFFTDSFLPGPFISFVPEDLVPDVQESEFIFAAAGVSGGGTVDYEPIPEPATVLGLIALGAGSLFVRKQQA